MDTYPKKRLEIIVEAPALNRVLNALDQADVSGYTVLPALAGKGSKGPWQREGLVSAAGKMVMIVCILDEELAGKALDSVFDLITHRIGIVTISNVEVVRDKRF